MPTFNYEALHPNGRSTRGSLEADSAAAARQQLRQQGLAPVRVQAEAEAASQAASQATSQAASQTTAPRRSGIKASQVALLVQQLASLLQAGLTLAVALQALVEQSDKPAQRQLLQAIRADVLAGNPLSMALGRYPRAFPELVVATIAAGEQTGQLATVMEKLADTLQARQALQQKVVAAFIYPAIVTAVALLVVVGLLTYVVPQVVAVFENTQQALPTLTVVMMAVSAALRQWGWAMALGLVLVLWAGRCLLRVPHWRLRWDTALLRWPLVGPWVRAINSARLASTLAILVGSGVPMLQALAAARRTLGNHALQQAMDTAHDRVREGSSLAKALGQSALFPPVLVHLVASGEATGRLAAMLERAATAQRSEVERKTLWLTSLLEPCLILFMGLAVLLIVLAVMLPIIEVNQLVA